MTWDCQLSRLVSFMYPHRTSNKGINEELPYCLARCFHNFSSRTRRWYSCCHDHYNPWLLMRLSERMFCVLWHLPKRILTDNRLFHVEWKNYLFVLLVKHKRGTDNEDFQLSWVFNLYRKSAVSPAYPIFSDFVSSLQFVAVLHF